MLKRAIVVGASSGMGAELVRRLAREGYLVAAIARRESALLDLCNGINAEGGRRAWAFVHDVTDLHGAADVFDKAVQALGGLDLVVYAAGIMPEVGIDQFEPEVDRQIVEVNVIGAMTWLDLAAERFRVQKGGTIVGIGSVAGERGRVGNPAYCASKAALHTYLEALRNRLTRHGVHVLTVKPGPVRTPMTEGRDKLPFVIDADVAVDAIFKAIARRAQVVYVPAKWALIMAGIRSVPSVIFRRTNV